MKSKTARRACRKGRTNTSREDQAVISAAAAQHVAVGDVLVTGPQIDRVAVLMAFDKIVVSCARKARVVAANEGDFRQFLEGKQTRNPRLSVLLRKRGHEIRDLDCNAPLEHLLDPLTEEAEAWLRDQGVREHDSSRLAKHLARRVDRLKLTHFGATNTVKLASK